MQMNLNQGRVDPTPSQSRLDPIRTDRTSSGDDPDVAASVETSEEPIVIGPEKARAASTNRMPARVLLISLTLTAALFVIGYLLVR